LKEAHFLPLTISFPKAAYFDQDSGKMVVGIPAVSSFARHTQGLRTVPVDAALATLV
jgi:hypothetical protein